MAVCGDVSVCELITILCVGNKVHYTVPSFPVFSAQLVEVKFQFADGDTTVFYDGYIRDCPELARTYPALIKICCGYTNAFAIEQDEFEQCIAIEENKLLYEGKVFIMWKWTWEDCKSLSSNDCIISMDEADSADSDLECEDDELELTLVTHSLIFKCIGATKSLRSQEVLAEVAGKLKKAENVEVRLRREPSNPKDSRAIAFDCKPGRKWELIGYVVKEALDGVHDAINNSSIVTIQFEWIRFITHWSRSGPGWYSGIKIKIGQKKLFDVPVPCE